jgi:hypothetical protein
VGWIPYFAFMALRWAVKLASVVQDAGFPLPPGDILIKVCKAEKTDNYVLFPDYRSEADFTIELLYVPSTIR